MDMVDALLIWIAFCVGSGICLLFFAGVAECKARKRSKWLQELQRIEDEEQAEAVSRKK